MLSQQNVEKKKIEKKIVGFGGQLRILLWKNLILSKRNTCGLISEVILPIALIIFLILMRYLVDVIHFNDQINRALNVVEQVPANTSRTVVMFYPNNSFIENIVVNAVDLMQSSLSFGLTGN